MASSMSPYPAASVNVVASEEAAAVPAAAAPALLVLPAPALEPFHQFRHRQRVLPHHRRKVRLEVTLRRRLRLHRLAFTFMFSTARL